MTWWQERWAVAMWQSARILACGVALAMMACTTGWSGPADDFVPADGSWQLVLRASDVAVWTMVAAGESDDGSVRMQASGHDRVWQFGKSFGYPCLANGPDEGMLLVLLPYGGSGGTGVAAYNWVVLVSTQRGLECRDMGLWRNVWASRGTYDFRIVPRLTSRGENNEMRLDFLYHEELVGASTHVEGRLLLGVTGSGEQMQIELLPMGSTDAEACVALLSSRMPKVREWAGAVLESVCQAEYRSYIEASDETDAEREQRRQELMQAIRYFYGQSGT